MTVERFKLSIAEDTEGYITDKIKHKTYFLRGDTAKKEITGILNQLYNENEDLKTDISVLNRHYDEYANICTKLKKENEQLKSKNRGLQSELQIFKEDVTHSNLQINKLTDENEQLKQFQDRVFSWIDMHLQRLPTLIDEEFNSDNEFADLSLYSGAIQILETMKRELKGDAK